MAATSKIHEFPSELIAAIAVQAEKTDLLSLRAVCRKWNAASDDIFLNVYFTTRTHLFWGCSLDALKSISQVPRLAKAIKEIRIVAQCSRLTCSASQFDAGSEGQPLLLHAHGEGNSGEVASQATRLRYSDYGNLCTSLQDILSNIAKYSPTVSFAVSSRTSEPAYGRSEFLKLRSIDDGFQRKRDDFGCSEYHRCNHEVPELILDAAARSSIVIQCLDIGYDDRSYGLFPLHTYKSSISEDQYFKRSLKAPFSNLTSVKLGIYAEYWKFSENASHNLYNGFKEVLQASARLQELSIAVHPDPSIRAYDSSTAQYGSSSILSIFNKRYIEAPFSPPHLKQLELKGIYAPGAHSRQILLNFIRLFSQTLRHLKLVRLFQTHRFSWALFMEGLASLPHIEQVDICGMDTIESLEKTFVVENFTFICNGTVGIDGERDITTALKNFANELNVPDVEEGTSDNDDDSDNDDEDVDADDDGDGNGNDDNEDAGGGETSGGNGDSSTEHVEEAASMQQHEK